MAESFLYEKLDTLKDINELAPMPDIIEHSLSQNIVLREYQKEAFQYFVTYFEKDGLRKNKQIHTLFHMATGSGKTVMMAGLILYLYTKGYRKFLFFVNQTNILKKTEENFLNALSSKYLFADNLSYLGMKIKVKKVDRFSDTVLDDDIELLFTTTQKLHTDMWFAKENAPTYTDFENDKIVLFRTKAIILILIRRKRLVLKKMLRKAGNTQLIMLLLLIKTIYYWNLQLRLILKIRTCSQNMLIKSYTIIL